MGRRRSAVTADERIAVAVLWCGNRLLLQLRDFRAGISDPGEWGFFGGHLKDEEAPDEGLRRELLEELEWAPAVLHRLGSFRARGGRSTIIGYSGRREASIDGLVLREGQDLGAFALDELSAGTAFSRQLGRRFALTEITLHALHLWCALSKGPTSSVTVLIEPV